MSADRSIVSLTQHPRSRWPARVSVCLCLLASALGVPPLGAVTMKELLDNPKLSAKKYASYFADFRYEFNSAIQTGPTFLARERGDCDDYAVLADYVLTKHGQKTRLIHIRLAGRVAHAVCYVEDNGAYLDYNNRSVFFTLTKSDPSLREIATKVARSLEVNWTTASEFTYSYATQRKTMISTISQTGAEAPTPGKSSPFHVD